MNTNKGRCKWLDSFTWVCCNGDCPLRADSVGADTTCLVCKWFEGVPDGLE